jgi:hypothetical protein
MTRKGFETLMCAAGKAAARLAKDHAPETVSKTPVVTMLDPRRRSAYCLTLQTRRSCRRSGSRETRPKRWSSWRRRRGGPGGDHSAHR